MVAEEFSDAIRAAGIPLYIDNDMQIRSVISSDPTRTGNYVTVEVAKAMGKSCGRYELGYDGATALELDHANSVIVLRALNNTPGCNRTAVLRDTLYRMASGRV